MTTTINKQQIAVVFQTKKGLHEFLTVEAEFFLPSLQYVNIEWLREIWSGKKKASVMQAAHWLTSNIGSA